MKTLLIHPDDDAEAGAWANEKWSRIIDLGIGGFGTYERWGRRFGCPILPIDSLRKGLDEPYRVRQLIETGKGWLLDGAGIDWWETLAGHVQWQLEKLVLVRGLVGSLETKEEVHISRPGFYADALRFMLGTRVRLCAPRSEKRRLPARYFQAAKKFPAWQLAQIIWDKYDPSLEFRRHFARPIERHQNPVVLVPSAYISVTRTVSAYATIASRLNFLLVAARRSAWAESLPANMKAEWLASYAKLSDTAVEVELPEMLKKWELLRSRIVTEPELELALKLGLFDGMPERIRAGLHQRAAWEAVFRKVNVMSVLCADDSNPWTRVPLLLGKKFGIQAVSCHHGALDAQAMLKDAAADVVLAKGKMEQDYLVRICSVPTEKIEVGAPSVPSAVVPKARTGDPSLITFFSELYEAFGGRGEEFYCDLLPPLAMLAWNSGKKLVVKLHPAESENERRGMIERALSRTDRRIVEVVSGAMTPELLRQTWFGITVLSTVASECAMAGVPCFLCRWLEFAHYGYLDQFLRFGAGLELNSPSEIATIPQLISRATAGVTAQDNLLRAAERERLEELLSGRYALVSQATEIRSAQ